MECLGGRADNPLLSVLISESAAHRRWGGGLPLTGGGEGAEEGRGRGEEERGVGVEGAALRAERGGLTIEPWTSVLASKVADPSH